MTANSYSNIQQQTIASWQKLQFGMFVHFGLYSLAGGCWDGVPVKKGYCEQILSHGEIPQADYENLIHNFFVPNFNAENIACLAKAAGMRYIVLTSKHHEGFCLFNTKTTDYNSVHSVCKRDLVGELSEACKKVGLAFGLYFSLIDWHCPWAAPMSTHNSDPITPKHHEYNLTQLTELLTQYGDICELWLDMGHPTSEQSQEMYEIVHSLQKNIMINGRIWNDWGDFATLPDNEVPELPAEEYELNVPWQTPASIYKETWGYKSWQERTGKNEKISELTANLRRVVAKGGNYLLNIGPDSQGAVVPFEKDVLEGIGRSLKDNPLPARSPVFAVAGEYSDRQGYVPQQNRITAEEDDSFILLSACTKLFRYTGEEYYSLRPIVTGKRWYFSKTQKADIPAYVLGWKSDEPLKDNIKLCFADNEKQLYFSLKKGKTQGIISCRYFLPNKAALCILELSTAGTPLQRSELPISNIKLYLHRDTT